VQTYKATHLKISADRAIPLQMGAMMAEDKPIKNTPYAN
jgi:hypothetical protein